MTEAHHSPDGGPNNTAGDSVVAAVDEEIRLEVLRQLNSINCDDDDWRIKPLPTFQVDELPVDDGSAI